ncbi:MAG TPA: tripartite tricarboxylate transporter permease [Candidatus Paceibacterota bacterium]|nr:tripartite tricarboxylate transporter permease [Candidatus Paceibacterota bacterium]
MIIELIIALIVGVTIGIITGLTPGIHINLVGAILISSLAFFLKITTPNILIVFIVSMSIAHTFVDFIPSIFLGAPEEETVLSILPGHKLLKEGFGYEAVYLTSIGCVIGTIIFIFISIAFIYLLPKIENLIVYLVPFVLTFSLLFILYKEKNKVLAIIIIFLSGFLGLAVLNSSINEPLLPLLSGLFGISSLIISIKQKTDISPQIIKKPKINLKKLTKPILASLLVSPLCGTFPGLGSGQASFIGASIFNLSKRAFLVLIGIINILILCLSFIVLFSLGKYRTGIAANISSITQNLTINDLILIIFTIIVSSIFCFFITLYITKKFSKIINKINYQKISFVIICLIIFITFLISGLPGLFILIISTTVGIFGVLSNVKRISLMSCLVIPTILYYLI